MELKIGDKLKDNDPRQIGRVLTVTDLLPNGITAVDSMGRAFVYLRRRVFTDGKPRKSGLSLVREA